MRSIDARESRPPLHDPESGFGLTLDDLGGVSQWSRRDMLGEKRIKHIGDESIGAYSVEGFMHEDPETGEAYISERPDGGGRIMRMSDVLPLGRLGGPLQVEMIIRTRELPEEDETTTDTSNDAPSIPIWSPRG